MQTVAVSGELRTDLGRRASRTFRRNGLVPCELYGHGENIHFTVSPKDLKSLVYTADFKLAEIAVNGKTYRAIMKGIQFHPVSDEILHVDFLTLEEGRKVKVEVPVKFVGVSPGVKTGGKLTEKLKKVSVKALPKDLLESIELDISVLNLGQSVRVKDIEVGEGIEILNNPNIPVGTIEIPRALKSAEEIAEEEAEAEAEAEAAAEAAEGAETPGDGSSSDSEAKE